MLNDADRNMQEQETFQTTFRIFKCRMSLTSSCSEIKRLASNLRVELSVVEGRDSTIFCLVRDSQKVAELHAQEGALSSRSVLPFLCPPTPTTDLVLLTSTHSATRVNELIEDIEAALVQICDAFSEPELQAIVESMPLLMHVSPKDSSGSLADFALVWRDHFLEENVGLLQAFERAGIEPKWIRALDKGDQTIKRNRISAFFRSRGYITGVFDNAVFSDARLDQEVSPQMRASLEEFVNAARAAGKKVMVIDDGAIVAKCFHHDQKIFDFALELTVAGLYRLQELASIDIPIYNLAHSQLKTVITYPEIAESCVMRIRELLSAEKFIGRSVVIVGYGTAGHHIARILSDMGCIISVVDNDIPSLIEAAERGFRTFKSTSEAIRYARPFLLIGCSGAISITWDNFHNLPQDSYVTAIASKDLSELKRKEPSYGVTAIPNFGYEYIGSDGKRFYQLGDGRSINLFESEAIPNKANDVFKAGIFVAAKDLAARFHELPGGIYLSEVDEAIRRSGLLETYYDFYLRDASTRAIDR